jgi:hypothetical protein
MIKPPTKASQALLAAITPDPGKVSTAHTDSLYVQTEAIHDALELVRVKMATVQSLRRKADAVEEDDTVYSFFECIKQTCDAADRIAREALNAVDALRDVCFQLDTYGSTMRDSIDGRAAREARELARLAAATKAGGALP